MTGDKRNNQSRAMSNRGRPPFSSHEGDREKSTPDYPLPRGWEEMLWLPSSDRHKIPRNTIRASLFDRSAWIWRAVGRGEPDVDSYNLLSRLVQIAGESYWVHVGFGERRSIAAGKVFHACTGICAAARLGIKFFGG